MVLLCPPTTFPRKNELLVSVLVSVSSDLPLQILHALRLFNRCRVRPLNVLMMLLASAHIQYGRQTKS